MALQARINNSNVPFILFGDGATKNDSTILTDAGRTTVLAFGTVMAKVAASQKWVPLTNLAATDGSAHPQGIYVGAPIAAADIVAGDVEDVPILVGSNVYVDENQVVLENSLTLDDVLTVGTTDLRTVRDHLATRGIFTEDSIDISSYENT